ncbi:hypothetical protein [Leptolyngbya sp. Cla-17]|nr:hypothetical protein [Leptolyngbya sp. Cla-17]
MLAGARTDRPPTTPHPKSPGRLRTDRSPFATVSPIASWMLSE